MLILERKIGQSIVINNEIYITTLGMNGNQIRLGIDAPKSMPVHREEIQMKIQDNDDNPMISVMVPKRLTRVMTH